MDRFEQVALARRHRVTGSSHKQCRLTHSTLADVARRLEIAFGRREGSFDADALRARLHIISAEIAEGFFADAVVLVEGVSDRAAIMAAAALGDVDLEALGIAVLPVAGKTKLDRPLAIFTAFEIPTFVVWDCDRQGLKVNGGEQNRALQRLMGVPPDSVKDSLSTVTKSFACFETKLEKVLKEELGVQLYQQQLDVVKAKYGIEKNDDAEKAPFVMHQLLAGASSKGKQSATLQSIVQAVVTLRNSSAVTEQAHSEEAA